LRFLLDLDAQNYANNSFDRQAGKQTKGLGQGVWVLKNGGIKGAGGIK